MRETAVLNKKISTEDFANDRGIINVTRQFDYWGDVETEIMILCFGDESLCLGYHNAEFYEDVYLGDYLEFKATLIKSGNTSRTIRLETYKIATPTWRINKGNVPKELMTYFEKPKLIAEATSILVVKKELQRGEQPDGIIRDPWREVKL
ncbi:beta-alanyl-CoA:ammonia lyase [Clostridium fermenticellae]|uniref:Beta-alanyl-CoA:ammonia lyase n=1 Tax=Clostridium fermenticellae TaxID=2068654 RepID=A0A386H451_9CLOT|nr:beta-alanyl-CoA:ammonia lyase [Clostridium fermenticellae]AYD40497.1 beta-alanyl-CoA:ammonia lyase [Clostridium fermenticellae]